MYAIPMPMHILLYILSKHVKYQQDSSMSFGDMERVRKKSGVADPRTPPSEQVL